VHAFGDSITEGAGATDLAHAYAYLMAARMGLMLVNHGLSGGMMEHTLPRALGIAVPPKYDLIVLLVGYNDVRFYGANVPQMTTVFGPQLQQALEYLASHRTTPEARTARERLLLRRGLLQSVPDSARILVGNCLRMNATGYTLQGPNYAHGSDAIVDAYNVEIAKRVLMVQRPGCRVTLVDVHALYDPDTMASADNIHPNDAGHAVLANAFIGALP
jgi:lysophospholipase L1-like esterase